MDARDRWDIAENGGISVFTVFSVFTMFRGEVRGKRIEKLRMGEHGLS